MPATRFPIAAILAIAILGPVTTGCLKRGEGFTTGGPQSPKFTATSYMNDGADAQLMVDVRAAQVTGPRNFLPLLIGIEGKNKERWVIAREDIVLELPEGTLLPVADYDEFLEEYRRARNDLRLGEPFFNTLSGRFSSPPFTRRSLDFFPEKTLGIFPRKDIGMRRGEVLFGYLYFRLPEQAQVAGVFKLLVSPQGYGETLVVDFEPFPGESR